jgi:hypothetical protein
MIEFGKFSQDGYADPKKFAEDLEFLRQLPRELRFLDAAYFDVLKANGVAHIFSSWSRMPSLRQQILIKQAFTASFTSGRTLLRPGRPIATRFGCLNRTLGSPTSIRLRDKPFAMSSNAQSSLTSPRLYTSTIDWKQMPFRRSRRLWLMTRSEIRVAFLIAIAA